MSRVSQDIGPDPEFSHLKKLIWGLRIREIKKKNLQVQKTSSKNEYFLFPDNCVFFQFQEDLDRRYNMEKEKLYKIRLLQVSKNKN